MRLRLCFLLTVTCLAASPARASGPSNAGPDGALPESSRWISFLRIIEGRWRVRTEVMREDAAEAHRQYLACTEDAWFLASPNMLERQAPCGKLLVAQFDGERESSSELHHQFRDQLTAMVDPPHAAFRDCAVAAAAHGDVELLPICGLALRPRARMIASVSDDERFGAWLKSCKRVLLGDPIPVAPEAAVPAGGAAAPPDKAEPAPKPAAVADQVIRPPKSAETIAEEDSQSRHCFRTFPVLYEVRWLKKLSDFWTPEEQRQLYLKSQQLGQN